MTDIPIPAALLLSGLLLACQGPPPPTVASKASGPPAWTAAAAPAEERASLATTWAPTEDLDLLLLRAELASPQVESAYRAWEQALARIPQAQAPPDPWVRLGIYLQSVETRTGPMDGRLGVDQRLPWPGKLELAGDQAAANAEVKRLELDAARLHVRHAFLRDFAERLYLERAMAITTAQTALLEEVELVSLSLYEAGKSTQADVLRAQVELLEMEDRVRALGARRRPLEAAMEAGLGAALAPDASWDLPWHDQPQLPALDTLLASLEATSPALLALQAEAGAAEVAVELSRLEDRPDFSLGVDWTWIGEGNPTTPDAGDDALALSLAMELPLQRGRIAGARREALAARQGAKARRTAAGWRLRAQLEAAAAAHEDAGDRHRLFEERLLPAANQTFETTLSAYQSGQAGFQDMLDAAQVVLDLRLAAVRAEADAARAYAELLGLLPEMPRTEDSDR